ILEAQKHHHDYAFDVTFPALKKAATQYLENSPIHNPVHAQIMLSLLAVCVEDDQLEADTINTFLDRINSPKYHQLKRFLTFARHRQLGHLSYKIVHEMIQNGYLISGELKSYLSNSMKLQKSDEAWRTTTVLLARTESLPYLEELWQVSGENRKTYYMTQNLDVSVIQKTVGYRMAESSVNTFLALQKCGYRIPELVSHVSYRHQVTRWKSPPENSLEERILDSLKGYLWLKRPSKRVAENYVHPYAALGIPGVPHMANSDYSICASYLFEYLGLIGIQGDLFRLAPLFPLTTLTDQTLYKQNPTKKIAVKWYRSLAGEERMAWLHLSRVTAKKNCLDIAQDMMKMTFRLALLMIPSHYQALKALQRTSVPLAVLRDLEAFILSDAYSEFRVAGNMTLKVPIPSYPSIHSSLTDLQESSSQDVLPFGGNLMNSKTKLAS
ncbi:MAG: hypothetical protein OXC40_04905, partial [Proteobacteria bacterium]|nr:hypothetical protein [Pseudomonadota bacterium]